MFASDLLVKALKATALVVLLALAWAVPAQAHQGHGARSAAMAASVQPQAPEARPAIVVAGRAAEAAPACDSGPTDAANPPRPSPGESSHSQACCGTMCTVALVERGIGSLPLRTAHRIRLGMPPETLALARATGPEARPPRTIDIA